MENSYLITGPQFFIDGKPQSNRAVLILNGRIEAVLDRRDAPFVSRYFEVVEYPEQYFVMPSFVDSHAHMASHGISLNRPSLEGAKSLSEALSVVAEYVRKCPRDVAIFVNFDQSKWKEGRLPTRAELDRISRDKAIILRRICGHVAVGNTRALEMLPDDVVGVDFESGVMLEEVPINLHKYFPPTFEEIKEGILRGQKEYMKLGVASVHEFGTPRTFSAYTELLRTGHLKVRVYHSFYSKYLSDLIKLGLRTGYGDEFLKIGGIKTFADGSVGARSAAFYAPYLNSSGRGYLFLTAEQIRKLVRKAEENSLQVMIHAIGDRAIGEVLEGLEISITPGNPLRHRIEHFEFPTEQQIKRVAEMKICLSMQPNFVIQWGGKGAMYEMYLGAERWKRNNPFKTIRKCGINVAFGSDCMPPSPLYGLEGAVNHPVDGESIDGEEALRLYTEAGAFFSFEEDIKGRIEEGFIADLVVLDCDPLERGFREAQVVELIIGGKRYRRKGIEAA